MKRLILILLGLLFAGGVATSATIEVDEDFMRNVEDISKALADDIGSHKAKDSSAKAKELVELFSQVEAFYVAKGDADDAIALSRKSKALSSEIAQLVDKGNFDVATEKSNDVARNCKTCHNFYKKS